MAALLHELVAGASPDHLWERAARYNVRVDTLTNHLNESGV
jgi:hypothetical protein